MVEVANDVVSEAINGVTVGSTQVTRRWRPSKYNGDRYVNREAQKACNWCFRN